MGGLYEKEICGFSTHYCPKRKVIPNTPIIGAVKWCRLLTAWSKLRRNTIATINVTYAKVFPHDKSASFDIDYVRVYQNINYEELKGLRLEARQKLNKLKPTSVGQASRISGISPADISVLLIYLEQRKRQK